MQSVRKARLIDRVCQCNSGFCTIVLKVREDHDWYVVSRENKLVSVNCKYAKEPDDRPVLTEYRDYVIYSTPSNTTWWANKLFWHPLRFLRRTIWTILVSLVAGALVGWKVGPQGSMPAVVSVMVGAFLSGIFVLSRTNRRLRPRDHADTALLFSTAGYFLAQLVLYNFGR